MVNEKSHLESLLNVILSVTVYCTSDQNSDLNPVRLVDSGHVGNLTRLCSCWPANVFEHRSGNSS
jgi:hypothetical protein